MDGMLKQAGFVVIEELTTGIGSLRSMKIVAFDKSEEDALRLAEEMTRPNSGAYLVVHATRFSTKTFEDRILLGTDD